MAVSRALDISDLNFLPQNLVLQHWDLVKMNFRLYFQSQHITHNLFQRVCGRESYLLYVCI